MRDPKKRDDGTSDGDGTGYIEPTRKTSNSKTILIICLVIAVIAGLIIIF